MILFDRHRRRLDGLHYEAWMHYEVQNFAGRTSEYSVYELS